LNLSDELFVNGVSGRENSTDVGENPRYCVRRSEEITGARVGVGGSANVHVAVAASFNAESGAVKGSISVAVIEVVGDNYIGKYSLHFERESKHLQP